MKFFYIMLIPSSHLSFVNTLFLEASSRTPCKNIKDNSLSGSTNRPPRIKRLKKKTHRKRACTARM